MFSLETASNSTGLDAFTLRNRRGGFCGYVTLSRKGHWNVWFNEDCTKGSARKFANIDSCFEYIRARRIKKGWSL